MVLFQEGARQGKWGQRPRDERAFEELHTQSDPVGG